MNLRKHSMCACLFGMWILINDAKANNDHPGNPAAALSILSGTYTIGTGGDYLTLTAAVNDYNTATLAGPVIFVLKNASYGSAETFPIVINRNTTASATNTLTIKPANAVTASITATLDNDAMFKILGSYVTIDGSNNGTSSRNLSFINNGSTLARTILIGSTGTTAVANTALKNCNIIAGTSSSNGIIISDGASINSAGYFNNITIDNNAISRSYYGIYCNAVVAAGNGNNLLIQSNDLNATGANAIQYGGIFAQGVDGAKISYNNIGNFTSTDAAIDFGIYLATGTKNSVVLNNTITNLNYTGTAGYGSLGVYINTDVSNANILLAGNMIANISGDGNDYTNGSVTLNNPTGILLIGPQTGIRIFHNSIFLGGVTGFTNTLNKTNSVSVCIRIFGSGTADIRNNIMVNNLGLNSSTGYGAVGLMVSFNNAQFTSLNYNDYFINPTGTAVKSFGMIAGVTQTTFASWKTATGKDVASVNTNPVFVSSTNLHLVAGSNALLSNAATAIAGFAENDIDNSTRNGLTPDIGCDEFVESNTSSWVGKTSTDWLTASNWEANTIPDGTTDVYITGGYTFMPVITSTQAIKGLIMSAPATPPVLTINGGNLQINGSITRTGGNIDASNATIEMNGTAAQNIPAGLFVNNNLKNLVIGNSNAATGVSLGGQLDIYESLVFSAPGLKLTTNDYLTFKSTASETAWLGNVTGKTISGNVTVERYIPTTTAGPGSHGKSWQLLSVPVSGNQTVNAAWQEGATSPNANPHSGFGTQVTSDISGATVLGFDVYTPAGASMKTYNASTGYYVGIANTNVLPVTNQKGYMVFVRGDRSIIASNQAAVPTVLRATGKLYTTGSDLPPSTNVMADKFESVGNPYASAIDFTAVTRSGAVDNVYYVWDPLLPGSGYGAYQTISSVAGWIPSPGGTSNYPSGIAVSSIQSGQAFFVHATGAAGTISFTEAAKIAGSKISFRTGSSDNPRSLRAVLYNGTDSTAGIADGNVIAFSTDYSNDYNGDDALKFSNGSANFGIASNGRILAVEARNMATNNDTIFYTLSNLRKQAYQFRFAPVSMQEAGLSASLEDRFLHTSTPISLSENTAVSFSVTADAASGAADRFYIIFQQLQVLPVTFKNISAMRTSEKNVAVNWEVENELSIKNYELQRCADGNSFAKINTILPKVNNGNSASYSNIDEHVLTGDDFYRVKATSLSGQIQYSPVVKVVPVKTVSSVIAYPNPVTDNKFSISFNNKPAGDYAIRLMNELGQVVYSTKLNINGNNVIRSISLEPQIAAGNYQLIITGEDGVRVLQQMIIE